MLIVSILQREFSTTTARAYVKIQTAHTHQLMQALKLLLPQLLILLADSSVSHQKKELLRGCRNLTAL